MRKLVGLAGLLVALTVALAACSGSGSSTQAAKAGQQNPWQKTALWVQEQGGQPQAFENGKTIAVGDVNIEVFVAPYPPLREGSIDLYMTDKAMGKPVESSGPEIIFDMYMPHGSIRTEALPTGGGHYLVPYKLVMPGEWRVDITISRSREVVAMAIIFRVD
ncbi:MAG TPA: FixH family protein [Dehalococcoidia bacterium]|nr:FixH family protein [Dehalococcoidia bacterium]